MSERLWEDSSISISYSCSNLLNYVLTPRKLHTKRHGTILWGATIPEILNQISALCRMTEVFDVQNRIDASWDDESRWFYWDYGNTPQGVLRDGSCEVLLYSRSRWADNQGLCSLLLWWNDAANRITASGFQAELWSSIVGGAIRGRLVVYFNPYNIESEIDGSFCSQTCFLSYRVNDGSIPIIPSCQEGFYFFLQNVSFSLVWDNEDNQHSNQDSEIWSTFRSYKQEQAYSTEIFLPKQNGYNEYR